MANRAGSAILDSVSSAWLWGEQVDPPLDSQSLDCFLGLELYPNPPNFCVLAPGCLLTPRSSHPRKAQAGGAGSWGRRESVRQGEGQGWRGHLTLKEELGDSLRWR